MREIIIDKTGEKTINFRGVDMTAPIFAKRSKKITGMIVKEDCGWILRLGGTKRAAGHHKTLLECIKTGISYGYTFFVN